MVVDDEAESHDDDDDDDNDDNDEEDTGSVNEEILVTFEELEEEDEIDDESGEGDDMGDLGDDDDAEEDGDYDDEDSSGSDDDVVIDEIVEQFMRTFHNGDYDNEFDDELSYDRGATSPGIRPTQASYKKTDNWRERNRIGLKNLKRQLQSCIDSVTRDNSFNLELRHNRHENWEMPIVWHEPVLDEYWNKLEAKICLRASKIKRIYVENVEMKKERLAALVAMFVSGRATNSCTSFYFDNANLCGEGIRSLSELVDVSSKLCNLTFSHNRIDIMDSARCLSRSLRSHTCINYLDLTHCDLGSSPEILLVILQSDVKWINLIDNNIDSVGVVKIAEYLEDNPPIRRIVLDHNRLNDDDAILISQALKRNTNLSHLDLERNNLTSIGVKVLLTSVYDSSSLNAISESNHTLERLFLFSHQTNESLVRGIDRGIDRLIELERTEKIVLALQDKDSLLTYLANVPVELIPEVLAFPLQQFDNQPLHKHLNIIYSTMRWWNMPMLHSYHQCVKSDTKRERDDKRN